MRRPLAILISDIHLSLTAPRCRAKEKDWMEAQARPLREIKKLQNYLNVPVICAGDIFNRWDSNAELINFALEELPENFNAVAGNHDLPYHDLKQVERCAYHTLCLARKVHRMPNDSPTLFSGGFLAYGYDYGNEITPPDDNCDMPRLAVVHEYCWYSKKPRTGFPGAPIEATTGAFKKKLKGFDVALFGDNHTPFLVEGNTTIYNHGNLIRRTVDECRRTPEVGILMEGMTVVRRKLKSAALDLFDLDVSAEDTPESREGLLEFVRNLQSAPDMRFDFRQAVDRYVKEHRPSKEAVTILKKVIRDKESK